jgi:GNAT superfamily N-acetyltransferase
MKIGFRVQPGLPLWSPSHVSELVTRCRSTLRPAGQIRYKSPMIIRECLASDAAAIETLFHEFVAYLRTIGDKSNYRFGAEQYLTDGFGVNRAFRGFVAEDESGLVGYVLFCGKYDGDYIRNLYVIDLYVQQASRGHGAGRMLMNAVQEAARAQGITRLSWSVHKTNAGALRFYEALGAQYSLDTHVMHLDLV